MDDAKLVSMEFKGVFISFYWSSLQLLEDGGSLEQMSITEPDTMDVLPRSCISASSALRTIAAAEIATIRASQSAALLRLMVPPWKFAKERSFCVPIALAHGPPDDRPQHPASTHTLTGTHTPRPTEDTSCLRVQATRQLGNTRTKRLDFLRFSLVDENNDVSFSQWPPRMLSRASLCSHATAKTLTLLGSVL